MRTATQRASRLTISPSCRALRGLSAAFGAAILLGLIGCGGGGDTSPPTITVLPDSVTTNPTRLTFTGGTATFKVKVDDSSGVNPSSVKIDIVDTNGVSLIGGPKTMTLAAGQTDIYTYTATFPNNLTGTAPNVYTASVNASDTNGNTPLNSTVIGTVTVPNPAAPPPSP